MKKERDNEMSEKRNKKGQFLPGQPPGPGRGNKKDRYPEADSIDRFKEMMEPKVRRVIAELIDSSDPRVKRDGAKLYIQLYGIESEAKRDLFDPVVLDIIKRHFFGKDIDDSKED
jgi:hypothetical protein